MKKLNFTSIAICSLMFCFIFNIQAIATNYYVKTDGAGTGLSWDDAMPFDNLIIKLASDFEEGDVVYMAGGTYKPASSSVTMNIINGISIIGGFDPSLSGTTVPEINYPSLTPTIISGDLNSDGIPNAGDARLVTINSPEKVTLKGITFTNGYATSTGTIRPGIQVLNGSQCDILYCVITNNKSDITYHINAGGAGLFINKAMVYCYATVFTDNVAANRGAAIRIYDHTDRLVLERCQLSGNINTGDWSGAIMFGASDCKTFCINSTIANNSVGTGGGGLNGAGWLYLISSTVANNTCTKNLTVGLDIRLESTNKVFAYNSIITNSDETNPSIFINGTAYNFTSNGNNVFGKVGGTGTLISQTTDSLNKQYSAVFGSNVLANNAGYPQTIALKENITGSTLTKIQNYTDSVINNIFTTSDLILDGRGTARPTIEPVSVGAFQYTGVTTTNENKQLEAFVVYPTFVLNSFNVLGAEGAKVSLFDINGKIYKQINCAENVENIDVTNLPKGLYVVLVNNVAKRIIKQ